MDRVPQLIADREREGYEVWIGGGASPDQVIALERALGVSLPPSYVTFLTTYGSLGIGDSFVSGIIDNNALDEAGGSTYGDTLEFRTHDEFPSGLIVIGKHEDGAYCLDPAREATDREYPVVNFEFGSVQHQRPVASNFLEWLVGFQLGG